ncbi:transcriptional-regulating factor 1 isoform X8 [Erythrolamprus reginae]|uniref:transcriptional-regulating factor 1 isoform X8 n=1 Tax=Erythrolamprus reginae TaxID=121349 RepID=UPI00396C4EDD
MGDQQAYKTNHIVNNSENVYYQQQHLSPLASASHNYGTSAMHTTPESPLSPSFPHDARENISLNVGPKGLGLMDSPRQADWAHLTSGNHLPVRNSQHIMWNPMAQSDPVDGFDHLCSQSNDLRSQKITSGVLHKLDSFAQVFASQNLRIQVNNVSQHIQPQPPVMENAGDSALRQLLSQKPAVESQLVPRYQQMPQQVHPGFGSAQQKQQMQLMQHQPSLYYDNQQHVAHIPMHSAMHQGQAHLQQMHSQHLLPPQLQQDQYYLQQSPHQGQHRLLVHEMQPQQQQQQQQQPRQCPMQTAQYYPMQPMMQQLQQQQMQTQLPPYHRDSNQKTLHEPQQYSQDRGNSMQLIQLGAVPPYFYQDQQQSFKHLYPQSVLQQQQPPGDASQPDHYQSDGSTQALMDEHLGLPMAEGTDDPAPQGLNSVDGTISQQSLRLSTSVQMNNKRPQQLSPSAVWPQQIQLLDGSLPSVSPEQSNACDKEAYIERSEPKSKLTCSVCLKEFKSLPALNGHMRSHGGIRASPIFRQEPNRKHHQSINSEENIKSFQDKKKYRHRPEPLFIPPPSFNLSVSHSGATLYQSQLRSPRVLGDHVIDRTHNPPPYTPPPMLSPIRQGSGLFSSVIISSHGTSHPQLPLTPLTPTPRILLGQSNSIDGNSVPVTPRPGEQTIHIEPCINIGSRFQADIPELKDTAMVEKDDHKATLVWKPWPELEDKTFEKRVTNLLNMCCSSILTGGGTNIEYGLHSLFEAKGNIMAALEMLLLLKPKRAKSHPLANYHYAGSDQWTIFERKLFSKALATYGKDFIFVQKMVKSKTVAQCVEYYYTWKKIMHLGRRHRTRQAEVKTECPTSGEDEEMEGEDQTEEEKASVKEEDTEIQNSPDPPSIAIASPINSPPLPSLGLPATSFICEMPDCGAVFTSRQALNGHARIHGGTNPVVKSRCGGSNTKPKTNSQNDYCSVKSSPAHSTTSGETDPPTIFPCKECGKIFFKIKSRNAHMKTHRQQEEQQRQKAQKAAVAAEMAATIARTAGSPGHSLIPLDHLDLIKQVEQGDDLGSDVVQELGEAIDSAEVINPSLLLDEEESELLQEDVEL